MATINEIIGEQGYVGSAPLGGGFDAPIIIDTKPLNDLARYTMIYNKSKYDDNEKKAQDQAKQLAELTAYDLTAIPEEAKQLQGEYDKLYNFVRSNPNVLDYKNNPTGYTDFLKMKNDLNQKVRTAKGRNVVYEKWQSDINNATTPELKTLLKKQLAENIKSTNIDVPLPAQEKFDITPVEVSAPSTKKFDVTVLGGKNGNENIDRTITTVDYQNVDAQANAIALGIKKLAISPQELASKTKEEQTAYAAQSASGKLEPVLTAQALTEAIAGLQKDENGNFINVPSMVRDYWAQVDNTNNRILQDKNEIANPELKDKFGKPVFGGQTGVKPENYVLIDKLNPSAEALIKMRILAKAPATSYETKTTPTDNAIQYAGIAQKAAADKASNAIEWAKVNKKTTETGKAPDLVTQPALLFGEHINRLKTFFNKNKNPNANLTIPYDKTDEITRKALGLESGQFVTYKPDGTAYVNSGSDGQSGTPLTIEQQKNNFIVAVKGGSKDEAQVDAKFLADAETGIQGIWGTTSGKSIWDGWNGNVSGVKPQGGSTSKTTSESTSTKTASRKGKDGKVYSSTDGITWTAEDGTVVTLKK